MFPQARAASSHRGWVRVPVSFSLVITAWFTLIEAPNAHAAARRVDRPASGAAPGALLAEDLPELPEARDGAAVVATDDALFVIGGAGRQGLIGRLDRFDLKTRRWQTLSDELIPRRHMSAVLVDDHIYIFGGRGARGPEATVEAWDLSRGVLEQKAPMPSPRYFASAALFEGRVYVAGGTMGWGRTGVVEIYDPAADAWYVCAPLQVARDTRLVVADGALYALGGYTGEGVSTLVERYNGRRWVEAGRMPKPTSAFAVAAAGGRVYLFGDHRDIGRVLEWQPESGTWRAVAAPYFPRRHSAAVSAGDTIFVVGGSQPSGHKLATVERFAAR